VRVPILAQLRAVGAGPAERARPRTVMNDRSAPRTGEQVQRMACRCACGFAADSLPALEDHLFVFPEDGHFELAAPC
jgi:hypothetical protein